MPRRRILTRRGLMALLRTAFALLLFSVAAMALYSAMCPAGIPNSCSKPQRTIPATRLHLGVVACGQRLEETLTMIKSALVTLDPGSGLRVHIFCEEALQAGFQEGLRQLSSRRVVEWRLYPISFPAGTEQAWRNLFKPCACQRLFIPELLKGVDSLIYVDTDVLFVRDLADLWAEFGRMQKGQLAAMAPESEDRQTNWYVRFARHPFVPPLGVNSGVMLMNLTRMRAFNWSSYLWPLYKKYRLNITWGDQDIINIIFSQHTNKLHILDCVWNYRPDHCMYSQTCPAAQRDGASAIHGSRGYFHLPDKQAAFKAFYEAFRDFQLGDTVEFLLGPLEEKLADVRSRLLPGKAGNCAKYPQIFTERIREYLVR